MNGSSLLPHVLVSGYHTSLEESALLLVDLNEGTYRPFLPYPGPIYATPDTLYVARFLGAGTRLEKYTRDGLVWMRRLRQCVDTHSVIEHGDGLAVCSTGTNEVLFLDRDGVERRRWSPDARAENDSWHLNSLTGCGDRLALSCFGKFDEFRGWCGKLDGAGLVLDVETGQPLLRGITAPHDPHRLVDGWLLNESGKTRTVLIPDRGPTEVIAEWPGFPRGLVVLPDVYVVGVSRPRTAADRIGQATIHIVERKKHRVIRSIPLPYPEIGHIIEAPSAEVLGAVQRQQYVAPPCLLPERAIIALDDRAGAVTALEPLRLVADDPKIFRVLIRVSNRGGAVWATENDPPIQVSYQVVTADNRVLSPEGARTRLPVPIQPGKSLTFPIDLDLTLCWHLPAAGAIRITLLQESVAWWKESAQWAPALVPLPPLLANRVPPPSSWQRLRALPAKLREWGTIHRRRMEPLRALLALLIVWGVVSRGHAAPLEQAPSSELEHSRTLKNIAHEIEVALPVGTTIPQALDWLKRMRAPGLAYVNSNAGPYASVVLATVKPGSGPLSLPRSSVTIALYFDPDDKLAGRNLLP